MQTTIFDQIIDDVANDLLDALNEGRKGRELYLPQYCFKEGKFTVYMAANAAKETIFNALDENGKTPKDFSANWRSIEHILQDLKIKKFARN